MRARADNTWLLQSRRVRWRVLAGAAEFGVLALLVAVDFELGARLVVDPDTSFIAGALATAFVAIVIAGLALARRVMPIGVAVGSAFSVSLLASMVSVPVGSPALSLTETVAIIVLTISGIRGCARRGAIIVGAAALAVTLGGVLLRLGFAVTFVLLALLLWGCSVAGGLAGRYMLTKRESAVEAARRAERMELARELHDVVAHQVTGIVVQAQAAIAVAHSDRARVTEALESIEAAGAEALLGMRRMVGAMREESDVGSPLTVQYALADIPALVERFDPGLTRTTLSFEEPNEAIPPGVGESAYRVVREALTNVRRHAPEGNTRVTVEAAGGQLLIEIDNDGVHGGTRMPGSRGFGLTGMAERVTALGGTMRAGAVEDDTWSVRVTLPMVEER